MVAPFGDIGLENGSFPFFRLGDAEKYMYHRDFRRPPCDTKIFWGGATTPQAIHQSSRGAGVPVPLDVTPPGSELRSPQVRGLLAGNGLRIDRVAARRSPWLALLCDRAIPITN